jgi:hypothetical protein
MMTEQKIIRAKVGLLELAKQLGTRHGAARARACHYGGQNRRRGPHRGRMTPRRLHCQDITTPRSSQCRLGDQCSEW